MQVKRKHIIEIKYSDDIPISVYISSFVSNFMMPDIQAEQLYMLMKKNGKVDLTYFAYDDVIKSKSDFLSKSGIENIIKVYED
jgi:regulatory protein YycH of two-component signal transduction system YycFG